MSNEKTMEEILLSELNKEIKKGLIKRSDAVHVVELFDEEMKEGYSDGEALYLALEEIKLLKKEKPIFNGDNENECEEWANRE